MARAYKTRSLLEGPMDAAIPLGLSAVFISMILLKLSRLLNEARLILQDAYGYGGVLIHR